MQELEPAGFLKATYENAQLHERFLIIRSAQMLSSARIAFTLNQKFRRAPIEATQPAASSELGSPLRSGH